MIRESMLAVVGRNLQWTGNGASEPYEVGWASEAIVFVRALSDAPGQADQEARIEISPDGLHWCEEGTCLSLPKAKGEISYARVTHFGGWLRVTANLGTASSSKLLIQVHLKA